MRKIANKICGVLLLLLLAAGLAACGGEQNNTGDNLNQPTLEELSATIVAAGEFWEAWWSRNGVFSWEHIDDSRSNFQPFNEDVAPVHHPVSRGFSALLPSSGFVSLSDIGNHLLQFYTQSWVDSGQFAEPLVTAQFMGEEVQRFGWTNAFELYGDRLYIFTWNESQPRPNWRTATHTLIEQEGNRAIVETVVSTSMYGFDGGGTMPTITYRFTFIDGRIDSAYGRWHETYSLQDYQVWQGFYAPISGMEDARLFIYRAEDVFLGSFDAVHSIEYPNFRGLSAEHGQVILIGAIQTIYNVSLVTIENIFDNVLNQDGFTITDEFWITETLQPGEGITISDYISVDILPLSGITFTTAPGERHFFVINHDNSDSPHWFVLLDITGQILAG